MTAVLAVGAAWVLLGLAVAIALGRAIRAADQPPRTAERAELAPVLQLRRGA